MDKQILVYTYNGILPNNNVDTYNKMYESQKYANRRVHTTRFPRNLDNRQS